MLDEIDYYEKKITYLSEKYWDTSKFKCPPQIAIIKIMQEKDTRLLDRLVDIRKDYITGNDESNPLLLSTYFNELDSSVRAALILIGTEIEERFRKRLFFRNFEDYHRQQPIFLRHPELFEHTRKRPNGSKDLELIHLEKLDYKPAPMEKYTIAKYQNSYLQLNTNLSGMIPYLLISKYGANKIYVRLNPYDVFDKHPGFPIEEDLLKPPNPYWIETIKIYPNQNEGCEFIIPPISNEDIGNEKDQRKYWEYHIKGIRSLQVTANRKSGGLNDSGHLSMSLEELTFTNNNEDMLIGRMIHLDSIDPIGTHFNEVNLNHLDLAINVYVGEDIKQRLDNSLSNGKKVTNASFRTHLIRADNIEFSDLLDIAQHFFLSEILVQEWIEYQFKFIE
ncbi:hypothetical protein AAV35_011395 [Salimicrobium jeotgali]|uniref:Uncharacterized protein n=1 Tax=Salimicrobium jeotgali TaxID=1230341 RepID=K2H6A4_9BACI|nr:hypothetical protein [Salimicrobium jeotgali]AKG05320.1 hypothetical protein AAV35_011395 [Salimicrobium jeotgali]EKE31325.1 hypothetical protein MJ3_08816 [Salimicrobium jeotgali]MBM7696934.1 hypothetical protein [Salimicrobium jeotgali]